MENLAKHYSTFVSLGDNCEFGFAQRHVGVDVGALLKWAIVPPDALLKCLRNRFAGLYAFENLVPYATDMVFDKETGLAFHSEMYSLETEGKLVFRESNEERFSIYSREIEKINYLRLKLISQLETGSNIFVYKRNYSVGLKFYSDLSNCIRNYSSQNVLLVVESDSAQPASLAKLSDGLYIGTIEVFAPYEAADQVKQESWDFLVSQLAGTCMLDDSRWAFEKEQVDLVAKQAIGWSKGIAHELWFWSRWFETRGLEWPSDFETRLNPDQPLIPALKALIPENAQGTIDILDVGAGPMTNIGFRHELISLNIRACDPLADFYSQAAARHGVRRPNETMFAVAEDLGAYFSESSFDIVHCCNALDHSADPIRGITEMLRIAKRGGSLYLKHHINEAETENYEGFHQFNFDLRDGRFIIWNKSSFWDVASVLPIHVDVKVHLEDQDIVAVITKLEEFDAPQRLAQIKGRLRQFQHAFISRQTHVAIEQLELTSGGKFAH